MKINIPVFGGIRPQRAKQLLELTDAQVANNAKLVSGELRPYRNELKEADIQLQTLVRTIYLYRSLYWLEFSADVDLVEGPVAADTTFRYYYTGDGIPKKSNLSETITGSGALPINFFSMASPQPWRQQSLSNGGGGSGDDRQILYTWTVVTSWGEESAPAPVSDVITAKQGDSVTITNMDLSWGAGLTFTTSDFVIPTTPNGYVYKCIQAGTSGGTEPTWGTIVDGDTTDNTVIWRAYEDTILNKFVYRFNTGATAGGYQFVDSIGPAQTSYIDSKTDTELGELLTTGLGLNVRWDPPPDNLLGLTGLPGGILAGFVGKDIYFSVPYQPHAWPLDYVVTLEFPVVALGVMENNLVAATEQNPYILVGTTPESFTLNKMPEPLPCLSKRGLVEYEYGVLYPTTDGLVRVSEGRAINATQGIFTKKEWEDYLPNTFLGAYHDGKYFGFYNTGNFGGNCLVIDFDLKIVSTLDLGESDVTNFAPAVFVDKASDTLYYVKQTPEALLQIGGTSYPNRTNALVQIGSGDLILLIGDY